MLHGSFLVPDAEVPQPCEMLGLVISEVFSNLNDAVILRPL